MLPIYRATGIERPSFEGGTTRPSLMTVVDERDGAIMGPYVVKVFSQTNIQQNQATNKEVYASILASQFDLNVPQPALIHVGETIIQQMIESGSHQGKELKAGIYFGCEYIENAINYSKAIPKSLLPKWEIENIFAFDVLIRNTDRREGKPNLFLKDKSLFLIDHELCLDVQKAYSEYMEMGLNAWSFLNREDRKHVFLRRLQEANRKNPLTFDTFQEYLGILDLESLEVCAKQLESTGNETVDYEAIKHYLYELKSDRIRFTSLLRNLIGG